MGCNLFEVTKRSSRRRSANDNNPLAEYPFYTTENPRCRIQSQTKQKPITIFSILTLRHNMHKIIYSANVNTDATEPYGAGAFKKRPSLAKTKVTYGNRCARRKRQVNTPSIMRVGACCGYHTLTGIFSSRACNEL